MPDPSYSHDDAYISLGEAGRRIGRDSLEIIHLIESEELPFSKHKLWPQLRVSADAVEEYAKRHPPTAT